MYWRTLLELGQQRLQCWGVECQSQGVDFPHKDAICLQLCHQLPHILCRTCEQQQQDSAKAGAYHPPIHMQACHSVFKRPRYDIELEFQKNSLTTLTQT